MQHKTASEMNQEVVDGKDAEELFTGFVEGKEERSEGESVEEKAKSRIEKTRRFLEIRGVAR